MIRFAAQTRAIFLSLLGISWFWLVGALILAQLPAYAQDVLGGDKTVYTLLLAAFSIGTALGSLACERLSGHKVEIGLVPLGSIGMTVCLHRSVLRASGSARRRRRACCHGRSFYPPAAGTSCSTAR